MNERYKLVMNESDGLLFVVKALKAEMAIKFDDTISYAQECASGKPLFMIGTHLLDHTAETWAYRNQQALENLMYENSHTLLRPMSFCDPAHFLASNSLENLLQNASQKPEFSKFKAEALLVCHLSSL